MAPGPQELPLLKRAIVEALVPLGVNTLLLEVDYDFEIQSHPELQGGRPLSKADARDLAALCREHGIRLIPLFNCLGHQSWAKQTGPLLTKYPELDETPQVPPDNAGIYCRSWCPLNPKTNEIIFSLLDELADAFQADALHTGMDEVFLIGSDHCPRCKGKDPADLFARAVNDLHRHLVERKRLTMLIWGDRLLDDAAMKYGKWEASDNGTAPAIDQIPKDIIVCDWHYEPREEYPSVPYFQQKGFRVLPSSWKNVKAALALRDFANQGATDRMLGHLCTTWAGGGVVARALLGEGHSSDETHKVVEAIRACFR
jgi:hypothetical protein